MSYVVTDACVGIKDAGCIAVCPVDAIHPTPNNPAIATADQVYIDASECICCGLCVSECPAHAISHEDDLPPDKKHFIQINADWFKSPRQ
jgi:NAD-dependent dihydropyrimidine dehydrogenase PreA subunit